MPRRLAALAAVLACLLLAPAAFAEAAPKIAFRLDYQPPAGADCPSAEALALMLAGEFGYTVIRSDVSPVVLVEIKRSRKGLQAAITGPNPTGSGEAWHGKTDPRSTCGELAYDIAYAVKLGLGPSAWGSEEPPPSLAAPAEIAVARPEIHRFELREPEILAVLAPGDNAPQAGPAPSAETSPLLAELALGPVVSPLGLPSVGFGGGGQLGLRWRRFALAFEARGLATPTEPVGPRNRPVRASQISGSLAPCIRASIIDVCLGMALSRTAMSTGGPATPGIADGFNVGLAGRIAARWHFASRFALLGYVDGVADFRTLKLTGTTDGKTVEDWQAPAVRLGLGLALAMSFAD